MRTMSGATPFQCRLCHYRDYVAIGKSRLGARFYACADCSVVFMDPAKWSRPAHEQVTPNFAHLMPQSKKSSGT